MTKNTASDLDFPLKQFIQSDFFVLGGERKNYFEHALFVNFHFVITIYQPCLSQNWFFK
jgi:hypothetical protein